MSPGVLPVPQAAVGPGPRSHRPAGAKREVQKHVEITANWANLCFSKLGRPALASPGQPDPDWGLRLAGMNRQLDWVAVLGREHAEEVFRRLHDVVQRDVESARKHARADVGKRLGFGPSEFRCFDVEGRCYFSVEVSPKGLRDPALCDRRYFELEARSARIVVRESPSEELLTARPALYAPQHCLLDVAGYERPMRLCQFSRLALEPLFFPSESG